jgi:hypothetical protein
MSSEVIARVDQMWPELHIDDRIAAPSHTNGAPLHLSPVARILAAARELLERARA